MRASAVLSKYSSTSSDTSDSHSDSERSGVSDDVQNPLPDSRRGHTTAESGGVSAMPAHQEKYELPPVGWHPRASHQADGRGGVRGEDGTEDDSDASDDSDNAPLAEKAPYAAQRVAAMSSMRLAHASASPDNAGGRPTAVRNIAQGTSAMRPAHFVKPGTQQSNMDIVPPDMHTVQLLFEIYNHKVYMEGYLVKKHEFTSHGKASPERHWTSVYVELCGPILSLWDATLDDDSKDVTPQYINIADATVEIQGEWSNEDTLANHVFSVNSAGTNQYLFQTPNPEIQSAWVTAIRLSCFEYSRIHEIYTRRFITRPAFYDSFRKPSSKTEGWVQVRLPGSTEWQKYWAVVTDRREEKKLFGKKSVPTRGQMLFYDAKKAKYPVATIVNVTQAYMVYPESPHLIDMATIMKLEGNVFKTQPGGEQQLMRTSAAVLVMTSTAKELVQWLFGTFDAFKLYGRPARLLDDPNDINALNFAESRYGTGNPRLFLELADVAHIDVSANTLVDTKTAFAQVLHHRIKPNAQVYNAMGKRTNSMPLLSEYAEPPGPDTHRRTRSTTTLLQNTPVHEPSYEPPRNTPSPAPLRSQPNLSRSATPSSGRPQSSWRPVYNNKDSDVSDTEDDTEDSDDSESDSDSIFNTKPPTPTPNLKHTGVNSTRTSKSTLSSNGNSSQHEIPAEDTVPVTSEPIVPKDESQEQHALTLPLPAIDKPTDFASSVFAGVQEKIDPSSESSMSSPSPQVQPSPRRPSSASSSRSSSISSRTESTASKTRPIYKTAVQSAATATLNNIKTPERTTTQVRPSAKHTRHVSASDSDESSIVSDEHSDSSGSYMTENHLTVRPHSAQQQMATRRQSGVYENEYRQSTSGARMPPEWDGYQDEPYSANGLYDSAHNAYDYDAEQYEQYPMDYPNDDYDPRQAGYVQDEPPAIPQLGEHFATRNSLLDMYTHSHVSAREIEDNARMSGQPLVHIENNKTSPRGSGLVGTISAIEQEKKELSKMKLFEIEKERALEQGRKRYIEKRRSQLMSQSPPPIQSPPIARPISLPQPQSPPPTQPSTTSYDVPDPRLSMMPTMVDPRMSVMMQPMPMMQAVPMMQPIPMMQPMMDPRMMLVMQPTFGAYPMFQQQQLQMQLQQQMLQQQQQAALWNNFMMQQHDGSGAMGMLQPGLNTLPSSTSRPASSMSGYRQHRRQRSGHF